MSYKKVVLTNAMEGKIADYCAKNNIELNQANAYDVVIDAFKDNPVTIVDEDGEHDVTERIARLIECQKQTIERIATKADLCKITLRQSEIKANIAQSKVDSVPNIDVLVDNLYRLNIVDKNSYLALVCFLMQLKYSRDNEILEDEKTCVFFNGVARNGKSATAKAICDVESQYGTVFKAQSGKLLESGHEEQVWKSHLNYFDEVKPTDVDRELLFNIINGKDVELNPKNKKQYNYHVNTNNIFTSNDQISLMQRRISIIKFGDRLNGRPLGEGTLKTIMTDIMNSLPDFQHYYDLYNIVSIYNGNRVNSLALSNIIKYMTDKFGFVNETDERTLTAQITFAPHDIYNCVKNAFSKQIITSERQEAIRTALKYLSEKDLLERVEYASCTTINYRATGANYIKIMDMFHKINTNDEKNVKITRNELYNSLAPFFDVNPIPEKTKAEYKPIDYSWMKCLEPETHPVFVSADTQAKGTILYHELLKKIDILINRGDKNRNTDTKPIYFVNNILEQCITKDVCETISLAFLLDTLKDNVIGYDDSYDDLATKLYMHNLGITDEKTLEAFEKYKVSEIQHGCSDGMTIESRYDFDQRKRQEKQERLREADKAIRERKKEERQQRFEQEEGPMPTRRQMEAFKLALKQQVAERNTVNTIGDTIQSHKQTVVAPNTNRI